MSITPDLIKTFRTEFSRLNYSCLVHVNHVTPPEIL